MAKILLSLLLTCIIIGCQPIRSIETDLSPGLKTPPELTVVSSSKSISAKLGTYSWQYINGDGNDTWIESDSINPNELVKNTIPIIVASGSILKFNFNYNPNNIKVYIWKEDKPVLQEVTGNKAVVPKQKGLLVYEVQGWWKQKHGEKVLDGNAHYAFAVRVE